MKDEEPKPGVVIDVTPDAEPEPRGETPKDADTPTETARPDGRRSALPLAVAVIALLVVILAGGFGYRHIAQLNDELAALNAQLRSASGAQQQLQDSLNKTNEALLAQQTQLAEQREHLSKQGSAVDEARAAFQQQEQRLADENLQLQEREAELRAAVADVHRRVGRSGTQWMIAETEYLLRIANHRLILSRDAETARIAMELADQRLRDTQDPGWAGVREQIARDIAKLSNFEAPDSAGLAARLTVMSEQIPQLKIARATIGAERTLPQRVAREPGERSWDTLLDDVWAGFKDSVRIRERDKPVQAMLAPEHQFFLYENLKLHLEAARLGLARNDPALYKDNLATAADWLDKFFVADGAAANTLREGIDALRQVDIKPPTPDISQSLRALEVRQKLMEDIAPTSHNAES